MADLTKIDIKGFTADILQNSESCNWFSANAVIEIGARVNLRLFWVDAKNDISNYAQKFMG